MAEGISGYPQSDGTIVIIPLSPNPYKEKTEREVLVVTSTDNYALFGIVCIRCGEMLIAPERSQYVTSGHVRHAWFCESCGGEFETSDHLRCDAPSEACRTVRSLSLLVA
jgi:hypothetical protein